MVTRHDDHSPSATRSVEQRGHLAEALGRPTQVELVASGELGIDCIVDDSDDSLL
jgi:hypothetical protein